jgi:hypothetical protein
MAIVKNPSVLLNLFQGGVKVQRRAILINDAGWKQNGQYLLRE